MDVKIPQRLDGLRGKQVVMCVPDDAEWILALRSSISLMTRGRFWRRDGRENSIKMAQSIAREMLMTFCTVDLDARLSDIAVAIESIGAGAGAGAVDNRHNIDGVAAAISAAAAACCGGDAYMPVPDTPDTPANPPLPGDPPPPGASAFDEYLCAAGNFLALHYAAMLRELAAAMGIGYIFAAVILLVGTVTVFGRAVAAGMAASRQFTVFVEVVRFVRDNGLDYLSALADIIEFNSSCWGSAWVEGDGIDDKYNLARAKMITAGIPTFAAEFLFSYVFRNHGQDDVITYGREGDAGVEYPLEVLELVGQVGCTCELDIPSCGGDMASTDIFFYVEGDKLVHGEWSDSFSRRGRAPYWGADGAIGLRQGGSGYKPTQISFYRPTDRVLCAAVLARATGPSESESLAYGNIATESSALGEQSVEVSVASDYSWYLLPDYALTEGSWVALKNGEGTSTTSQVVYIKQIRFYYEGVS